MANQVRGPTAPFGFGIKKGNGERTKQLVNVVDPKPARINRRYKLKAPVVKSFTTKGDPCITHWDNVLECFEIHNFQRSYCVEPMTMYHECHQYYGGIKDSQAERAKHRYHVRTLVNRQKRQTANPTGMRV